MAGVGGGREEAGAEERAGLGSTHRATPSLRVQAVKTVNKSIPIAYASSSSVYGLNTQARAHIQYIRTAS